MTAFILRRVAALVVILVVVSFVVFSLLDLAPGSPEQLLLGNRPASPETISALRHEYHLDQPFFSRYATWLGHAARFDFGRSIRTSEPVGTAIRTRLGTTGFLGTFAFLITLSAGIPLGLLAAFRRSSSIDRSVVALTVIGLSAPAFASGIVLIYVFAVKIGWFPTFGQGAGFFDRVWHLTLPAIALALTALGFLVRLTRAAAISVLEQDYIVFARARGIPRRRVIVRYALRNALIPVTTAAGLILGYMLTGAILVEVTFGLPGVGALLVNAVNAKDIPVIQGVTICAAAIIITVNLITDLLYGLIDPRVGVGGTTR